MVERQLEVAVERFGDGPQPGVGGVGAGHDLADRGRHGQVPDGDDVASRVALRIPVGTELGEVPGCLHAGLLAEFPPGCLVERLLGPLEAAGQRPRLLERLGLAFDQQDQQRTVDDAEDHDVDGDRERREIVHVVAGRHVLRHGRHVTP